MSLFRPRVLAAALAFAASSAFAHTNERGLDPQNFDESAGACADFFQHANGGWLKSNPIPPEYSRGASMTSCASGIWLCCARCWRTPRRIRPSPAPTLRKIGDFYAPRWTSRSIDAAGDAPIRQRLARVDALHTAADVAALIRDWHAEGIPTLFDFGPESDMKNASMVIAYATQGGLGMPDRDYYLRTDAKSKALLAKYQRARRANARPRRAEECRCAGRLGARSGDAARKGLARSRRAARARKFVSHLHRQGRRHQDAAFPVDDVLRRDRSRGSRSILAGAAGILRGRRQGARGSPRRALAGIPALASGQFRSAVPRRRIRRTRISISTHAPCAAPNSSSRAGNARSTRPTRRSVSPSARRMSRERSPRKPSSARKNSSPISRPRFVHASPGSTGWPTRPRKPRTPSSTRCARRSAIPISGATIRG